MRKGNFRRRRRAGGGVAKRAVGAARKAASMNKKAKVASVVSLAKSVSNLRRQIRREAELKTFDYDGAISTQVGQVSGNNTGTYVGQLNLMELASGNTDTTRIGKKVHLKGIQLRMQFSHQSNASTAINLMVEVFKTQDFGSSDANLRDSIYHADSISTVVDYFSSYKEEHKSWIKRVAVKKVHLPVDSISGVNMVRDIKLFIKQNQELTYSIDGLQVPQNYRYFMIVRASVGNSAQSTASTLTNIVHTTALTGCVFRYVAKCWYADS